MQARTAEYDFAWILPNAKQPNTILPNAKQPNTILPNAKQPNTILPNAKQPNTILPNRISNFLMTELYNWIKLNVKMAY